VLRLIAQYERAEVKLYKPKGYTNEDNMRSIVMLRWLAYCRMQFEVCTRASRPDRGAKAGAGVVTLTRGAG